VHATPRRRSLPLLEHRLDAAEEVDQGETRRARKKVALVLKERVAWEVRADRAQEDREVQQCWAPAPAPLGMRARGGVGRGS